MTSTIIILPPVKLDCAKKICSVYEHSSKYNSDSWATVHVDVKTSLANMTAPISTANVDSNRVHAWDGLAS